MFRSLQALTTIVVSTVTIAGFAASASAANDGNAVVYEVAVTNLTKGQVFSPPVLVTHTSDAAIFAPGEPASPELVSVAENGVGQPLADLLAGLPQVFEALAAAQPIPPLAPPEESVRFEIHSRRRFDRLSMVSMLVNTNDAFLALDTVALPRGRGASHTYYATAYDAGSEANNEGCTYVPGPACDMNSGNERDEPGEGVIYVHSGVHGVGDLSAADNDWHNPVAEIVITRKR